MMETPNSLKTKSRPHVSVIIPTYKEAKNVKEVVTRVFRSLGDKQIKGECIIIDDNSSDGTESICNELRQKWDLHLIVRKSKRGLANAAIRGLRAAAGDILVVMDADLSHPPEMIPRMVRLVRDGADFVIGSRYVEGARIEADWGSYRKLNSRIATLLAGFLTDLKDPLSGFFCFPRKTLDACEDLAPVGYKIALEIIVKSRAANILEIPILFSRRKRGESKLNLKQQLEYVRHLARLYRFRIAGK